MTVVLLLANGGGSVTHAAQRTSSPWPTPMNVKGPDVRAVTIPEFGRLDVREVDDPQIQAPDDVIVRVAAAGVCRTDLETMDGAMAGVYGVPEFPYVPGHETTGWVEAVGSDVRGVAPGDAVLLHPLITCGRCRGCRAGRDMFCTDSRFPGVDTKTWGGWAEQVRTGERAVVPLPAGADLVGLSPYSDAGITAYHAVKRLTPHLPPDGSVVAIGVGGVGHFGVQLLRMMTSCTVIAVDVDPTRAKLGEELGAHASFVGSIEEHSDDIRDLTGGGPDAVVDFAGALGGELDVTRLVRRGGTLSLVSASGPLTLEPISTIVHEVSLITNLVGSHLELQELVALHDKGLRSLHTTYALGDAAAAVDDLRRGAVTGRAVLIP